MKWIFLYCSVFFLIGCGDETRQSEDSHDKNAAIKDLPSVDVEKINKDLAGLGHKTVSKFKDDTLTIDLYVLDEDYSSKYYIDILIEVLIFDISTDIYPNHKVKIVRCFENGRKEDAEIIDDSMILKIVAINKVKTYYDFKKYLVLNVKGEKLSNLNFIIDDILKNKDNKKYKNAVKGNDYIQLIMSYATDYCLSKQKNEFYRKLLIAVKEVAGNKKVWPNFNSEDIDYFLNYCGSQNDKAIEI